MMFGIENRVELEMPLCILAKIPPIPVKINVLVEDFDLNGLKIVRTYLSIFLFSRNSTNLN